MCSHEVRNNRKNICTECPSEFKILRSLELSFEVFYFEIIILLLFPSSAPLHCEQKKWEEINRLNSTSHRNSKS